MILSSLFALSALACPLILGTLLAGSAFADTPPDFKAIKQFPLDERTVYTIKIAKETPTTVLFPSAISGLEAAGITTDPQVPAPVFLHYGKGSFYFTVRALQENAAAELNVIWKRKTYVLKFQSDPNPFSSVTLYEPTDPSLQPGEGEEMGPTRVLGLLDRAKAYSLLRAQYPEAVSQIDTAEPHRKMLYKGFDVEIAEVFRFDPEDTLIFKLIFSNYTPSEIHYVPQALAVRVGTLFYPSALSDASGILPPGFVDPQTKAVHPSVSLGYFAIVGKPDGGRNNLAVSNPFNVIVTRAAEPVTLEALPATRPPAPQPLETPAPPSGP